MEIKNMIEEILENKDVDKFHIEFYDSVSEECKDICLVKVNMEKEYM